MKKFLFLFFALASMYADPVSLIAKLTPSDTSGYFVFSDGTFWKVSSYVVRWRSPLEWAMGEELFIPEEYICEIKDWSFGDEFEPIYKIDYVRVDEANASNESELRKHSHVLVHSLTGRALFATPVSAASFLDQIYRDGVSSGYSKGYSEGYSSAEERNRLNGQNRQGEP